MHRRRTNGCEQNGSVTNQGDAGMQMMDSPPE